MVNGGNQPSFTERASWLGEQVDGQQLHEKEWSNQRGDGQQVFAISFRVKCVTMMIGVAGGIVELIPPTQTTIDIQKYLVESLGLKDSCMPQFVWRSAHKEAGDCTMKEQSYQESKPNFICPKIVNECSRHYPNTEMT